MFAQLNPGFFHQHKGKPPLTRQCPAGKCKEPCYSKLSNLEDPVLFQAVASSKGQAVSFLEYHANPGGIVWGGGLPDGETKSPESQ